VLDEHLRGGPRRDVGAERLPRRSLAFPEAERTETEIAGRAVL